MNNQQYNENIDTKEHSAGMLFNRTRTAIYRLRELELAQFGLTVEQSSILYLLTSLGGSATAKTLEELTLRQHHSISTRINRMIKLRLVARKKSPEGKRLVYVTKRGEDLYKKVPIHSMGMVFSSLKVNDRERLRSYLDILLKKALDLLGPSYAPTFQQNINVEKNATKNHVENDKNKNLSDFELWVLFNRTRNAIYRIRELELAQFGLTVEQSSILYLLLSQGGSGTAKTLEELTLRQHHSISTLVNRMIKLRMVAKKKSPDGKRLVYVTKRGEDLYKKMPIHSMGMVFSSLKVKDMERLHSYLDILLEKTRDLLGLSYVPPFLVKQFQEDSVTSDNAASTAQKAMIAN
jgi:DNA-binding MarR family transcriptional regulator